MTNCFDKIRLQQLIAETTHVENLAANVFHIFFLKMQEQNKEMKTAALLPVDEAKEAIQDLIYEFRVQDPSVVKSLGELFDLHCLDPNGFTYHAFISLLLILIRRIVSIDAANRAGGGNGIADVHVPAILGTTDISRDRAVSSIPPTVIMHPGGHNTSGGTTPTNRTDRGPSGPNTPQLGQGHRTAVASARGPSPVGGIGATTGYSQGGGAVSSTTTASYPGVVGNAGGVSGYGGGGVAMGGVVTTYPGSIGAATPQMSGGSSSRGATPPVVTRTVVRAPASTPSKRISNRFAHINLLPVQLTPRGPRTSVVPALGPRAPAAETNSYYYRVSMPEGGAGLPLRESKKPDLAPNQLMEMARNCGPGKEEVDDFKHLLHDYATRMSTQYQHGGREEADLSAIRGDLHQMRHNANQIREQIRVRR